MSQAIHQAQAVKNILNDASLPMGERPLRALSAFREIDVEQFDEALIEQLQADAEQISAVLDDSMQYLDRTERTLEELKADLEQVRADVDEATQPPDRSEAMLDKEQFDKCQALLDATGSFGSRLVELLDSAASRIIETELDRIVADLDVEFRVLPEGAIREAREHRDLIVPRLIEVLKKAIARARAGDTRERQAHFFAVFLLTEFKADEAFPVMLEAFSLPDDLPSELLGDAVYELPARILALFRGDSLETIESLIDDETAVESLRWQAATSYLHLVREGRIERDEAVRRLQRHLRRAIDQNDAEVATALVSELSNYAPVEALDDISEAYQRNLVETFMIGLDDVKRSIAEGEAGFRQELGWCRSLDVDTLEELRTWGSFQEKKPAEGPSEKFTATVSKPAPALAPHFAAGAEQFQPVREPIVSREPRVGRNDPCPCGSGKKFKKCCGARNE